MKGFRNHGLIGSVCSFAAAITLAAAATLIVILLVQAGGVLDFGFLVGTPSRFAAQAGVGPALAGTLWLTLLTAALACPVGVGAAVYFAEYAPRTRAVQAIESAVSNLAGVPPLVFGVTGLALYVRGLGLGPTVLAGGLTLAMLALPTVVVTSKEAIQQVPAGVRAAAYALGATRWEVLRRQVLPAAAPGILTGVTLALARTAGAAAPLLVIGAASFITYAPATPGDLLVALPTQVFAWSARSQPGFAALAAAAGVVLLALLLVLHLASLLLRRRLAGAAR
ncbi:MAG: phosphate ABC transporter permease PstA [Gemmatimonadota bacterium]|nr:phosphate ABC transporter permease PstA [Gemmatimonadota bacterium]